MSLIKDGGLDTVSSFLAMKMPVLPVSTSAPLKGRVAYDTSTDQLRFADGETWNAAASGMTVGGVLTGTLPDPGLGAGVVTSSNIANTGVVAGTYGDSTNVAQVTVNSQGQVTSVVEVPISGGTVTQIDTGTGLTGGPITATGTISVADTAVAPGTYGSAFQVPVVTVNQQGQVTSASTVPLGLQFVLTSAYRVVTNQVVPNNVNIIFDGIIVEQIGSGTSGVWVSPPQTSVYMITFYGTAIGKRGEYQLLLNGPPTVGTVLGYCTAGNDAVAIPLMAAFTGTASMTITTVIPANSVVMVGNVHPAASTMQGGFATVVTFTRLS